MISWSLGFGSLCQFGFGVDGIVAFIICGTETVGWILSKKEFIALAASILSFKCAIFVVF